MYFLTSPNDTHYPFWIHSSEAETTEVKIGPEGTNYKVAAIARHPQYDQVSLSRDLGLVVLKEPIQFDQYVDKICLPTSFTQLNSYSRDCHVSTLAKEFEPSKYNTYSICLPPLPH